jgi:hypothetical protein
LNHASFLLKNGSAEALPFFLLLPIENWSASLFGSRHDGNAYGDPIFSSAAREMVPDQ